MSETSSNAIPANLPLRNDLIGEEPYGAPQLDVPVCLNVNENPYAPEPAVCDTIAKRVREIAPTLNRYPDREHIELRQAFSDYLARESVPVWTSTSCGVPTAPTRSCCSCSRLSAARAASRSVPTRRTPCTRSTPATPSPVGSSPTATPTSR